MKRGFRRGVATFSLVALFSVVAAAPSNGAAAPTGVGTAQGATQLINLQVGSDPDATNNLLNALVVAEENAATIDPALHATPIASQGILPLGVHSATVPALDLATTPSVETETTGAQDQKSTNVVDLGAATSAVPGALGGTINPATLTSIVDAAGARSTMNSSLADVQALAGLARLDSANLTLSGLASPTQSLAQRGATVDAISAVNLGDVLQMLGVNIDELTTFTLVRLVEHLGLIDDINDPGVNLFYAVFDVIYAEVVDAEQDLADKQQALADATAAVTACGVDAACLITANAAKAQAQIAFIAAAGTLGGLNFVLGSLLDIANDFRDEAIEFLATMPLINVQGVAAGATALAKDTTANSAATVTGSIDSITIASLPPVGPVDATSAADQLAGAAATINGQLDDILSVISPFLAGMVQLDLFPHHTNVFVENGYVKALANITALVLTITPPDICSAYDDVFPLSAESTVAPDGVTPDLAAQQASVDPNTFTDLQLPIQPSVDVPEPGDITDVLDDLGSYVDNCPFFDNELTRLGLQAAKAPLGSFTALSEPATFRIASLSSASEFKVAATPETPAVPEVPAVPALPRTGMNETLLLVIGGLMAAAALGLRRVAAPQRARSRRR